jgi:hypothetical protein
MTVFLYGGKFKNSSRRRTYPNSHSCQLNVPAMASSSSGAARAGTAKGCASGNGERWGMVNGWAVDELPSYKVGRLGWVHSTTPTADQSVIKR